MSIVFDGEVVGLCVVLNVTETVPDMDGVVVGVCVREPPESVTVPVTVLEGVTSAVLDNEDELDTVNALLLVGERLSDTLREREGSSLTVSESDPLVDGDSDMDNSDELDAV
jgi:hypothetical protein